MLVLFVLWVRSGGVLRDGSYQHYRYATYLRRLSFAHRAFCASEIRRRGAADIVRFGRLAPLPLLAPTSRSITVMASSRVSTWRCVCFRS
jgi:hypothetical protein